MALTGVLVIASFAIGIVTGILQRLTDEALAGLPIGRAAASRLIGLVVPVLLIFAALWTIYRVVPNRPVALAARCCPARSSARSCGRCCASGSPGTRRASPATTPSTARSPPASACIVFLYFASCVILIGAEVARANALSTTSRARSARPSRDVPPPGRRRAPPPARSAGAARARRGVAGAGTRRRGHRAHHEARRVLVRSGRGTGQSVVLWARSVRH